MEKRYISIGFFKEMQLYYDCGSIKDWIVEKNSLNYNKTEILNYLYLFPKHYASCPRDSIDCVTGEKIDRDFFVYTDGIYEWCSFLAYHIQKYNILLPQDFVDHVHSMRDSVSIRDIQLYIEGRFKTVYPFSTDEIDNRTYFYLPDKTTARVDAISD